MILASLAILKHQILRNVACFFAQGPSTTPCSKGISAVHGFMAEHNISDQKMRSPVRVDNRLNVTGAPCRKDVHRTFPRLCQ